MGHIAADFAAHTPTFSALESAPAPVGSAQTAAPTVASLMSRPPPVGAARAEAAVVDMVAQSAKSDLAAGLAVSLQN